ncbi:hypothetical protein OPU39_06605, partial [Acinetobacter nosocomialis]|nr:hypothetical protein [Acinetobacter nosocomialis]
MLQNSKRIGFLLLDNFSMIAFSNMVEVLRMANYVTEDNLYQWNVTGLDGHQSGHPLRPHHLNLFGLNPPALNT